MTKALRLVLAVALLALAAPGASADELPPPEPPPSEPTADTEPAPLPPSYAVPTDPSLALREANAAATTGDWARVSVVVETLLARSLDRADLAEAHRLAGIAALFAQPPRRELAEHHFLQYLRIDLDGQLDPALYPPEVVTFFSDVRARHSAELRALRPKPKRYAVLNLVPPFGQFQNGERTKGIVVGALLGTFLAANLTSYFVLRSWCTKLVGPTGKESAGCDETTDRYGSARTVRSINITAGVGLIVTYVYGVYDGVRGYGRARRERSLVPYASSTNGGAAVGLRLKF